MKTLDRTIQPEIKLIDKVALLKPEEVTLDNGIPLYSFNVGTQDVIKIECIFDAGTWYQIKKLTAFSTAKMLKEGTKEHSSAELAEIFDSCGAYIETEAEKDYSFVTLYSLNKHLEKLLPVFASMVRESIFPQHELSVLLANSKQELLVSMERVSYIARIKFAEQLFGEQHPYGQAAEIEDYDKVIREDLAEFHKKYYHPGNLRIVISGKIEKNSLPLINKYMGNKDWRQSEKALMKDFDLPANIESKKFFPKENVLRIRSKIRESAFYKTAS